MWKVFLSVGIIGLVSFNLFVTYPTIKRDNYVGELIESLNLHLAENVDSEFKLDSVYSPMLKKDSKDADQINVVALYHDNDESLIGEMMVLPDGIEEPFTMGILFFNLSKTEEIFQEKYRTQPFPDRLDEHKASKPCFGEVVIPVMKEYYFQVNNLSSIETANLKYNYHNFGYCTKKRNLADRYLEIDGKTAEYVKFKTEYRLPILHFLYPSKYSSSFGLNTVSKYGYHIMVIFAIVAIMVGIHFFYIRQRTRRSFDALQEDPSVETPQKRSNNNNSTDIELDDLDAELEAPTKNNKVSFKNAQGFEKENLLNQP
ncbi:hypothetical protein PACTADRAFT_51731, partial [Pachysolen tannophilus NRRL Y-2460]